MPFEYNIEKENLTNGYVLKAFALLFDSRYEEAEDAIEKVKELNLYDFRVFAFSKICDMVK